MILRCVFTQYGWRPDKKEDWLAEAGTPEKHVRL